MTTANDLIAFPQFAPLSRSHLQSLLLHDDALGDLLQAPTDEFRESWIALQNALPRVRNILSDLLHPLVLTEQLRTGWITQAVGTILDHRLQSTVASRTTLREDATDVLLNTIPILETIGRKSVSREISRNTLSLWQRAGHLRRTSPSKAGFEPESVLSLLMMTMLSRRERDFLGLSLSSEPAYCYAKKSPTAPYVAVPMPLLPEMIDTNALYYTPLPHVWSDPCWYSLPAHSGCWRWGAARYADGILRWTISKEQLKAWSLEGTSDFLLSSLWQEEDIHSYAHTILMAYVHNWYRRTQHFAPSIISPSFVPAS